MSVQDIDIEKQQPMATVTSVPSNSGKPIPALSTYQMLVGDIDAVTGDNLYHEVVRKERDVNYWFWFTAVMIYTAIAAQVILCLGIAVGAQQGFRRETLSILAAVNTGVAASIGILKALGLPDKKAVEWNSLRKVAERIRITTRKLRAGIEVDAVKEADAVRDMYEQAEDEAQLGAAEISGAASAAGAGFKSFNKK